jgi:hypothetical protein
MPNYVQNRITFCGTMKDVEKVFDFLKGEDTVIDFNKIIPMPEELKIASCSEGTNGMNYLLYLHDKVTNAHLKEYYERVELMPKERKNKCIELGKAYLSNLGKYGYTTWYEWSRANWGTKWNAYSTYREGDALYFQTAWSAVPKLIEKIAEMFPNISLEYEWADEDFGYNLGRGYSENGEFYYDYLDGDSDEDWELIFDLWGCRDSFEKVDGEWRWKED